MPDGSPRRTQPFAWLSERRPLVAWSVTALVAFFVASCGAALGVEDEDDQQRAAKSTTTESGSRPARGPRPSGEESGGVASPRAAEPGSESEDVDEPADDLGSLPVEAQLAVIDGGPPEPSAAEVRPYRKLLDYFETTCPEDRGGVSDLAVRGTELLAADGIEASALDVLRGARELFAAGRDPRGATSCAEIFAAYVTARKSQP